HQFRDLCPLIGLVAAGDSVLDTMRHVIAQDLLLGPPQRGAHRSNLRDHIDAIAVLLDHLGEAADLTFDPVQALLDRCLDVLSHDAYIPLPGIGFKGGAFCMAEPSVKTANHSDHPHGGTTHETVRDLVCGMSVDPATSKHRFEDRGETFHFCSAGCRTKFMADPAKYLEKTDKPKPAAQLPEGTIYTCPMHPEIHQI